MTMYLVLLFILCMESAIAALAKPRGQYITNAADDKIGGNFSGFYIAVSEEYSSLCDVSGVLPLFNIFKQFGLYNSSVWYGSNGHDLVPLRVSYSLDPRAECLNETYKKLGFRVIPNIEYLKISQSIFRELWNFSFVRFSKLRTLDLSHNYISQIPFHAFSNLSNLKTLKLSSNFLTSWDFSSYSYFGILATASSNLTFIDLSGNRLHSIECSADEVDELTEHSNWTVNNSDHPRNEIELDLTDNDINAIPPSCYEVIRRYYKNVTININGNPVVCNCSAIHNLTSGSTIDDLNNCTCPYTRKRLIFVLSQMFFLELTPTPHLLCSVILILFGVLFLVVYRNFKYKKKKAATSVSTCSVPYCTNRIKTLHTDEGRDKIIRTHVYIVASPKDSNILDLFVDELETKRNIPVIFKERDEIPGYFKLELFRKWLSFSRRTIFLISKNFLEDTDCTGILTQAKAVEQTQARVIIIIVKVLENLPPREILAFDNEFVHRFCFDYNPVSVGEGKFWDELVNIIENNEMHVHVSDVRDAQEI